MDIAHGPMPTSKNSKLLQPHPATVAQRRAAPKASALPAHPATVARKSAPLGTVQRKPHPALRVAQAAKRIASVSAYRLERDADNPKVTNTKGKLKLSDDAKAEGISISFGSDEHVSYFFDKHEGSVVVMEIKKAAYEAIQEKLDNPKAKVDGKSLTKPSPCSDAVMKKLSIEPNNVLSFSKDWADFLEANVTVISVRTE